MTSRRTLLSLALGIAAQAKAASLGLKDRASDREVAGALAGKLFQRVDSEYEQLRLAATWNARKPDRFPAAIVVAHSDRDVIAAVKLAKARGWQVTTRSGGHSFTGSHTRNNALQINLAKMKEISVDPRERVARISPSWKGGPFNNLLRDQHRLTFPVAHGFDVGLGGFVLCGGHGWNSAVYGLGCENLRAIDVVTADGELIHCDERQNSDFLWAARGSGPGFFGVATRLYLDLHPQPAQTTMSEYLFPLGLAEEVTEWIDGVQFPRHLETIVSYFFKDGKPLIHFMAVSFASSARDLEETQVTMASCPLAKSAIMSRINAPVDIPAKSETEDVFSIATGGRFTVDGTYTNKPLRKIFSLLRDELAVPPPTPHCTFGVGRWQPIGKVKDMAYSITGSQYLSMMGISYDPADDVKCAEWVARLMARLEPISVGSQMNDENMPVNKLPYLSKDAAARLELLRAKYDPDRRFPSFLA